MPSLFLFVGTSSISVDKSSMFPNDNKDLGKYSIEFVYQFSRSDFSSTESTNSFLNLFLSNILIQIYKIY